MNNAEERSFLPKSLDYLTAAQRTQLNEILLRRQGHVHRLVSRTERPFSSLENRDSSYLVLLWERNQERGTKIMKLEEESLDQLLVFQECLEQLCVYTKRWRRVRGAIDNLEMEVTKNSYVLMQLHAECQKVSYILLQRPDVKALRYTWILKQ